jgi:hypothetical protein
VLGSDNVPSVKDRFAGDDGMEDFVYVTLCVLPKGYGIFLHFMTAGNCQLLSDTS